MDAGVVDLWWFGTACELLCSECVSSVSHGQHRLVRIGGVRFPKGSRNDTCARAQDPGANHVVVLLSEPVPFRDMRPSDWP